MDWSGERLVRESRQISVFGMSHLPADALKCVLNGFFKFLHKSNNLVKIIASVSTALSSISITQGRVCSYFKHCIIASDTQGRSLCSLSGSTRGSVRHVLRGGSLAFNQKDGPSFGSATALLLLPKGTQC